jgi:hypothetical protein
VLDFTSPQALGRTLADPNPERRRLWSGISANATLPQAASRARDFPALGQYTARLDIPNHAPVRWGRTLPRSRGHYTLWGEPAVLLGCVTAMTSLEA